MEEAGACDERILTEHLSQLVFDKLAGGMPDHVRRGGMKLLEIDEDAAKREGGIDSQREELSIGIALAYRPDAKTVKETSAFASREMKRLLATAVVRGSARQLEQLRIAFRKPYVGDAHEDFIRYLAHCWKSFKEHRNRYRSPRIALLQSSGFGKSRLLYEVAKMMAADADVVSEVDDASMRLLYICARQDCEPSGFPWATPLLSDFFFNEYSTVDTMAKQLVAAFYYAQQDWENVGKYWLELFSEPKADADVSTAIAASQPIGVGGETRDLNRVLVVAVDDALALYNLENARGMKLADVLYKALEVANARLIAKEGYSGGILVVMADANPKVYRDIKSSPYQKKEEMPISPFILTHTMDIWFKALKFQVAGVNMATTRGTDRGASLNPESSSEATADIDYKFVVTLNGVPAEIRREVEWSELISMGRPLWKACIGNHVGLSFQQKAVSDLAATKLLRGQPIHLDDSYDESTMFGVASVICRLGLLPRSNTSVSTRAVADLMGVLSYVFFGNDGYLTSYPLEPAVAFGAARLWYQLQSTTDQPTALEKYILPRFQEMIMEEAVDMAGVRTDEIAARIFLLLAMDETVMKWFKAKNEKKSEFVFAGQFCTVRQLLDTLGGFRPVLKTSWLEDATEEQKRDHEVWMRSWTSWKVCFCQFHDLTEEPTEAIMWFLLGRRAAGVFRQKEGASLVIPIFSGDTISFILVQVQDQMKDTDLSSTTTKLLPSKVFENVNPLSKIHPRNMIRVCITVCEKPSETVPKQMYMEATSKRARTRLAKKKKSSQKCR